MDKEKALAELKGKYAKIREDKEKALAELKEEYTKIKDDKEKALAKLKEKYAKIRDEIDEAELAENATALDMGETIGLRTRNLCRKQGMKFVTLAKRSGLDASTIEKIVDGRGKNSGIMTIAKICSALGVTLAEFFNHDAFAFRVEELRGQK